MPQFIMDKPKKPQFYAVKVGANKKLFKKYLMKDVFLSHVTLLSYNLHCCMIYII